MQAYNCYKVLISDLETAGRWSPGHMQQLDGKETWGSIFTHPQLVSEGPSTLRADGNMSRTSSSRPPLAPASRYVRVAYSDGDGDIDEEEEGDTEFDEGQDHLNGDSADADDPDEGQDTPWGDEKRHNGLDARANRDSEEDEQQAQDLVLRDYGGNGSAHDKHNCPDRRTGHKSERAQIQAQAQDTKNRDSTKNYGEQAQVDVCAGGPSEDERLLLLDIQTPADDDDDLSHTYSSSFNSDATNASCSSGSSGCSSSNIKSIGSMCSDERDTSSSSSSSSARKEEDQCYDAFDHSSAETYENYTGDSINWVADFDGSVEDSFTLIQNFYEVGKTT